MPKNWLLFRVLQENNRENNNKKKQKKKKPYKSHFLIVKAKQEILGQNPGLGSFFFFLFSSSLISYYPSIQSFLPSIISSFPPPFSFYSFPSLFPLYFINPRKIAKLKCTNVRNKLTLVQYTQWHQYWQHT